MPAEKAKAPAAYCILAFDRSNRMAVRMRAGRTETAFTGPDLAAATAQLEKAFPRHTPPVEYFTADTGQGALRVFFCQTTTDPADGEVVFESIDALTARVGSLSTTLAGLLQGIGPHLVRIPYLHLGENDFIFKFRPNAGEADSTYVPAAGDDPVYQSRLCAAIKALSRQQERTAGAPVGLDFGAVHYVMPSHFGFCLGVKNALERAYETLAENPGKRVFMLSELIHNPFVNEDLLRRGLRYLQSDRGVPYTVDGRLAPDEPGAKLVWDSLVSGDIVVIPAFGATDADKARLVRKGIPVYAYDATCMLVEKVWRAARAYGREGYTVVIHGKHEHEETKATFSNTQRHAQAVIVRNLDEARLLGGLIASGDPAERAKFYELFAGRHTPGFDVARDLERVAVVNQTTLLANETTEITEYLRGVYRARYGDDTRVGGGGRRDTLCYATQVNQDALNRALSRPLDAAFVVGGRNSSNTYQLARLCEEKLGRRAFYIQSEANILSRDVVEHTIYGSGSGGSSERRLLWPGDAGSKRVLVTGGASCPDGIIQQVITRINSLFPADQIRPIEAVLDDLPETAL